MISAFPLTWPQGQRRTGHHHRTEARFGVGIGQSRDDLLEELRRLGTRHVVISSNLPVRRDGLPYADAREPSDPGVAVYFDRNIPGAATNAEAWRPYVIACDTYRKLVWNLRAIGKTVEALRVIQRHGATSLLEQAFTGFAAPPAVGSKSWWDVLGVSQNASPDVVRAAFLELVRIHHPDAGGSTERMAEINAAYEEARKR